MQIKLRLQWDWQPGPNLFVEPLFSSITVLSWFKMIEWLISEREIWALGYADSYIAVLAVQVKSIKAAFCTSSLDYTNLPIELKVPLQNRFLNSWMWAISIHHAFVSSTNTIKGMCKYFNKLKFTTEYIYEYMHLVKFTPSPCWLMLRVSVVPKSLFFVS